MLGCCKTWFSSFRNLSFFCIWGCSEKCGFACCVLLFLGGSKQCGCACCVVSKREFFSLRGCYKTCCVVCVVPKYAFFSFCICVSYKQWSSCNHCFRKCLSRVASFPAGYCFLLQVGLQQMVFACCVVSKSECFHVEDVAKRGPASCVIFN